MHSSRTDFHCSELNETAVYQHTQQTDSYCINEAQPLKYYGNYSSESSTSFESLTYDCAMC